MREFPKTAFSNWSKQARVLCELLDEAREEFDQAVQARDWDRERSAFNEIIEIARLLDDVLSCTDEQVDDLLM